MSYAQVAATNIPPLSEQPQPDPSLLNSTSQSPAPPANTVDGVSSKVNVVSPPPGFGDEDYNDDNGQTNSNMNRRLKEAEAEGLYLWEITKHYLFRPGVAGGLVGLINLVLLAGAGHAFYAHPELRRDRNVVSSVAAATVGILGIEGWGAEKYRKTSRGQEEERRAKEEGALIYKHVCEHVLRPGVLGGIIGAVNLAVVGTVGYSAYENWNKPAWDRRVVSSVTLALATLWGAEGYLAEQYRKKH